MKSLSNEFRLIFRSRLSAFALLFLLVLSGVSVWLGVDQVTQQRHTIERLAILQEQDATAVADRHAEKGDAGSFAYYTFYNTWDAPSNAAYMALGMRDVAPYVLRIRALGLQAQIHDGETFNPELALPGRFDFAFVLIYLSPLFVIALLHDLISTERQSGRLRLLMSVPDGSRLFQRRAALRYGLLFSCLSLPLVIGALASGTGPLALFIALIITASYLAFWVGLSLLVCARNWTSVTNATALMGSWALLTLVLPTLANMVLIRAIPVQQGMELMLAQREAIHGAWEVPRDEMMQRFFESHPEWRDTAPLPQGFHWKWYLAFHQVGDESVAEQVQAYRSGLEARQRWTEGLGWLMPSVGAQAALHRIADTDLTAQLAYQDRITDFHKQIRNFYYDFLFNDLPMGREEFGKRPSFNPETTGPSAIGLMSLGLLPLCWLAFFIGFRSLGGLTPVKQKPLKNTAASTAVTANAAV